TAWLLGRRGLEAFAELEPAPPAEPASRLFASGGYVVLRGDWSAESHQLILDAGPLGCGRSGGHGHADLLALQCAAFGTPCIVDPGTFAYGVDGGWRDHFRGTAAHSTVLVDGAGQAAPAGRFAWDRLAAARLCEWSCGSDADHAVAEHAAYAALPDPVVHRRRVLFVKPRYFVVVDDLEGEAEHQLELRFQFAPLPVVEADGWVRVALEQQRSLLLRTWSTAPLRPVLESGWYSAAYGSRQAAPLWRGLAAGRLPLRFVTLLYPTALPPAGWPQVEPVFDAFGGLAGLELRGERAERIVIAAAGLRCEAD
ncbi:MAG TPA: heparinase II/III-family protein, partial [Candidatus Polarisedimenticolaceae bacterium]|nr:heparinase II/III-family protein [Candidatus Polarisedimenticolaceae bacterium]